MGANPIPQLKPRCPEERPRLDAVLRHPPRGTPSPGGKGGKDVNILPRGRPALVGSGGRKVGIVRSLTDAEATVIATLLAARPERERERLRQVGIPRSTYYAVRRRAYLERWLHDRYVPDPARLGRPYATFVIARPYADRLGALAVAPTGSAVLPVLWTSPQLALAILFHARPGDGPATARRWHDGAIIATEVVVTVDVRQPTVPVYFDFEGIWDHLTGLPGTISYPHGLGGVLQDEGGEAPLSAHTLWAYGNLLARPFAARENGEDGHQLGVFGLPFSERRLLTRGWVTHRVLLNPSQVPSYGGRAADRLFLIAGAPKPGARPDVLFARLTRDHRAFPFLYAVGSDRWMIGALGGEPLPPPQPDDRRSRPPILPMLAEFLAGIEIFQEPVASLSMEIDHRYDRLLPTSKEG